jgi:hypothetical protein
MPAAWQWITPSRGLPGQWKDCTRRTCQNLDRFASLDIQLGQPCYIINSFGTSYKYICVSAPGGDHFQMQHPINLHSVVIRRVQNMLVHTSYDRGTRKVVCMFVVSGERAVSYDVGDVAYLKWGAFTRRVALDLNHPAQHVINIPSPLIETPAGMTEWLDVPQNRKHVKTLLNIPL